MHASQLRYTIEARGARCEGLTVVLVALLRSTGGRLVCDAGKAQSSPTGPKINLLGESA
jgi:hypothetical protein